MGGERTEDNVDPVTTPGSPGVDAPDGKLVDGERLLRKLLNMAAATGFNGLHPCPGVEGVECELANPPPPPKFIPPSGSCFTIKPPLLRFASVGLCGMCAWDIPCIIELIMAACCAKGKFGAGGKVGIPGDVRSTSWLPCGAFDQGYGFVPKPYGLKPGMIAPCGAPVGVPGAGSDWLLDPNNDSTPGGAVEDAPLVLAPLFCKSFSRSSSVLSTFTMMTK